MCQVANGGKWHGLPRLYKEPSQRDQSTLHNHFPQHKVTRPSESNLYSESNCTNENLVFQVKLTDSKEFNRRVTCETCGHCFTEKEMNEAYVTHDRCGKESRLKFSL